MTQRTWQTIAEYLTEFDKREGAEPVRSLYLTLGNQALAIISRKGVYRKTWDNSSGGELTLTSATCPLPIDLLERLAVEYDGSDEPLEFATVEQLDHPDSGEPGWRTTTGDPDKYTIEGQNLVLNSIPSNATGKLVLRGTATLPEFSDTAGATNPLIYLPYEFQLLPAQYIISELPVTPAQLPNDTQAGAMWASQETQRRVATRTDARAKWEKGLEDLVGVRNRQSRQRYRF